MFHVHDGRAVKPEDLFISGYPIGDLERRLTSARDLWIYAQGRDPFDSILTTRMGLWNLSMAQRHKRGLESLSSLGWFVITAYVSEGDLWDGAVPYEGFTDGDIRFAFEVGLSVREV